MAYVLCDWWFDPKTDDQVWLRLVDETGHLMDMLTHVASVTVAAREIEECRDGKRARPPDHSI